MGTTAHRISRTKEAIPLTALQAISITTTILISMGMDAVVATTPFLGSSHACVTALFIAHSLASCSPMCDVSYADIDPLHTIQCSIFPSTSSLQVDLHCGMARQGWQEL